MEPYAAAHVSNLAERIAEYLREEEPMLTKKQALEKAYRLIGREVAKGLAPVELE